MDTKTCPILPLNAMKAVCEMLLIPPIKKKTNYQLNSKKRHLSSTTKRIK